MRGQQEFEELEKRIGNTFKAILYVNQLAGKISDKIYKRYGFRILESRAISIALTGYTKDDIEYIRRMKHHQETASSDIYDILSYVDDDAVCKCVRKSIKLNNHSYNLKYYYTKDLSDAQKVRVRVLTKIIWYKLLNNKFVGR